MGYWTGHEDYYDHTAQELYGPVVSTILSKLTKKFLWKSNSKDEKDTVGTKIWTTTAAKVSSNSV